jgi:hypothetical protein
MKTRARYVTIVLIISGLIAMMLYARPAEESKTPPPVRFVDVARAAGITFRHDNAASPQKFLIETMGSGAAWIDYDQD